EAAVAALPDVVALLLVVLLVLVRLLAADREDVVLELDVDVLAAHAGDFGREQELVAALLDVDRGHPAAAVRGGRHLAGAEDLTESARELVQLVPGVSVGIASDRHGWSPEMRGRVRRPGSRAPDLGVPAREGSTAHARRNLSGRAERSGFPGFAAAEPT